MFWLRSDPNVIRSEKVPSGPDTAIQTVPTGLVGVPPEGPATPVVAMPVHGACRPADALRHLLGDGTADGSEALQIAPVYAEQPSASRRSSMLPRRPGSSPRRRQGREAAGDVAARARLGRCDGRPASAEQVPRYALERDVPVSDDAVGDDSLQLFELPADFPLGLFPVDLVGRQAQADAQRAGQVGQMQVAGQRAFPAGDRLGQYRLGPCRT